MDILNWESTGSLERRYPDLINVQYKNIDEFINSRPPLYNLYYPEEARSASKFDIILRILPDPTSRIYSGVKKYELRKYVPQHTGLLFMLETGDKDAFTGCFYFQNYIPGKVKDLWEQVGEKAVNKKRFDSYFAGKEYGVALEILDFEKFDRPIPIDSVYEQCEDMPRLPHPYVYLYTPVNSKLSSILREQAQGIITRCNLLE
jgi:predicted transcriptional regulator